VGLREDANARQNHRDVLIPVEYVDVDEKRQAVRATAISPEAIAQLPPFAGLPIDPGYDEQFQMRAGSSEDAAPRHDVLLRCSSTRHQHHGDV
jgi:hypothetical protein